MRHAPEAGGYSSGSTLRTLLIGCGLAMSLTALACPDAAAAADTRKSPAAAPAKANVRVVSLRFSPGIRSTGLNHAVFLRPVADNTPTRKLGAGSKLTKGGKARVYAPQYAALQCVPFARAASGIELKGNAVNWWDAAAGVYERGSQPETGAVLNFRANGSMRLGHVAVVRNVVNSREIEIDHANWAWSGKGNVSRGVAVIDVSERNDWSSVRVALGHGDEFGSIYSTYGFIYDRPDRGTMLANSHPTLTAPPHDVRSYDELAEAPTHTSAAEDAPGRSLR